MDVCPVDCLHPRKDEPEFEAATMLYIHLEACIDCGACVPLSQRGSRSHGRRRAIVKAHIAAHPELMGIPAKERAAAQT